MTWTLACLITWTLAIITIPPAIGHAFNLGREDGWQEGYGQRVRDEKNGIPAAVIVPLPQARKGKGR